MIQFFSLPQKQFALIWSPKCACTTVSSLIAQYVSGSAEFGEEGKQPRAYLNKNGINKKGLSQLKDLFEDQKLDRFVVLTRDPISRLVSTFTNKFLIKVRADKNKIIEIAQRGRYEGFSLKFINDCAESGLAFHGKTPLVKEADVSDFSLAYLVNYINHKAVDIGNVNDHFSPQIKSQSTLDLYTKIRDSVQQFKILRVENLNSDLQELAHMLDFTYTEIHNNKSPLPAGWQKSDDPAIIELSTKELTYMRRIPTRKALYSYIQQNGLDMSAFNYDVQFFGHQLA